MRKHPILATHAETYISDFNTRRIRHGSKFLCKVEHRRNIHSICSTYKIFKLKISKKRKSKFAKYMELYYSTYGQYIKRIHTASKKITKLLVL